MPLYDLVHAIGTALPVVVHYHAHTVPASFVGDPAQYGLYHGATRLDTGGQGQPHLLSAVGGDPSYGIYEFRFESAYLDTLNVGDTYSFRITETGHPDDIWTLRVFHPTQQQLAVLQALVNSGLASVYARLDSLSALVELIYDYVIVGPVPPRLGQVNTVGDGNVWSTNYAGGSEAEFRNGRISDPGLDYLISPFNPGDFQLVLADAPPPLPFRTKDPICGLKLGTVLRASFSTDGVTYTPLGDDLLLDGTTNAQSSPLGTWDAYGAGGIPGVSPLTTLPNGDLVGYIRINYSVGVTPLAHYLDLKLEQVVGATTYTDYLTDYRPLPGVSGGVLVDPVIPAPNGTTQIVQTLPTPPEPNSTLRRLSGVLYATNGFLLDLHLNVVNLYRSCYGPVAGGGTPVVALNETELGDSVEDFDPMDLGSGLVPAYDTAVATALTRPVGLGSVGTCAAILPALLYHPFGDSVIANNVLADFCRVLTWSWAMGDGDLVLYFRDETRRCTQNAGVNFDAYDFSVLGPFNTQPALVWDSTQDVDYDAPDLGLQVLPSGLVPIPSVGDGLLIYPQHDFHNLGIPFDALGPTYTGRSGARVYRSYYLTPAPWVGGTMTLDGLTFAEIEEGGGSQVARIELRIPENGGSQWGPLGAPQGIVPFTGLYLGSPAPGDTSIPFAFTPGIHSTNGSSGDAGNFIQVRITFFDQSPAANPQYLGSLTLAP